MIDAELYKTFYTIALHRTISDAAKAMRVSQPAVSKAIRKFEYLTGCTLFIRKPRGVELTSEGQILFEYVKEGLERLESGENLLKKMITKEEGIVRVGISNTLCRYFFIPHLEAFHQKYPGIQIQVMNRSSPDTLKLLDNGMIDFGIVSIPGKSRRFIPGMDSETKGNPLKLWLYEPLITIHDIFVCGDRKIDFSGKVKLSDLSSYPLMLLEKENQTRVFIDDFCEGKGVRLKPEIEIGSMDFLIQFARIGIGIACVIEEFVKNELASGLLRKIPVSPALPARQIGIVRQKPVPVSNAAGAFMDFLHERKKIHK